MNVIYLGRPKVGYLGGLPRLGQTIPGADRTGLVLHHSVGGRLISSSVAQALVYVRRLQTARRKDLGADVPYNFPTSLIHEDNEWKILICEGRGWERRGAHTVDRIRDADPIESENRELVAFGWQGDWRKYRQTLAQHTSDPDAVMDEMVASVGAWARGAADRTIPDHQIRYFFGHPRFQENDMSSGRVV